MKSLAYARLKRARAVELLGQGMSYDEIAQAVGYVHRGSAHRAVYQALAEREVDAVDDLRALEVARLDGLQAALWDSAMGGDARAAIAILKRISSRIRLLDLDRRRATEGDVDHLLLVMGEAVGNAGEAT